MNRGYRSPPPQEWRWHWHALGLLHYRDWRLGDTVRMWLLAT